VTMSATLLWPTVTVLGFFVLFVGVVVALGTSSTARCEFERNGARAPQPEPAPPPAVPAQSAAAWPAPTDFQGQPQAVDVAVRPTIATGGNQRGWWLLDESAEVVSGPFEDRIDADWAALSDGLSAVTVFGARRADGSIAVKPSPQERAWLGELGEQLDRLPEDWDALLSDTDPLTTLVVEVAAAVVEAGLPLHDPWRRHAVGGVCLVPERGAGGVLVSWRPHDRMSLDQVRGAAADAAVQQLMNAALTDVLARLGFVVEPYGDAGCALVTALR